MNHVDFDDFGKHRELKFDLDAMCAIELELGMGMPAILQRSDKLGFNDICVMLSAGLRGNDATMTTIKVRRNIQRLIEESEGKESLLTLIPKFETKILDAIRLSGLFGNLEAEDESKNEETEKEKETI
jgi:hypothetical protein